VQASQSTEAAATKNKNKNMNKNKKNEIEKDATALAIEMMTDKKMATGADDAPGAKVRGAAKVGHQREPAPPPASLLLRSSASLADSHARERTLRLPSVQRSPTTT
jgi:hypothetical protein